VSASIAIDVTAQATAEGFMNPVVVMRSAYEATVEAPSDAEEADALAGLLQSAYLAVHEAMALPELPDRHRFAGPLSDQGEPVELCLLLSEPILVIALPDEA
jgi:hypothetical protein